MPTHDRLPRPELVDRPRANAQRCGSEACAGEVVGEVAECDVVLGIPGCDYTNSAGNNEYVLSPHEERHPLRQLVDEERWKESGYSGDSIGTTPSVSRFWPQ